MVTIIVAPNALWTEWAPVTVVLLGYVSHLLADAATKTGILLLYPNLKRFYLLPQLWRITTGSLAEDALLIPLLVPIASLLLNRLPAL